MDPDFTRVIVVGLDPDVPMDGFTVQVFVHGSTPLRRETVFHARFDSDEISALRIDSSGTGFIGLMNALPAEGAHLIVELEGREPFDTGLVYREQEPPIA